MQAQIQTTQEVSDSLEASNIVDLPCVVIADNEWFLSGLTSDDERPMWTNKVSIQTAQRYTAREAAGFLNILKVKSAGMFKRIRIEPTM